MTVRPKKAKAVDPNQSARFIEAARGLGCDESPSAFEAAVKKVARHKSAEKAMSSAPVSHPSKPARKPE